MTGDRVGSATLETGRSNIKKMKTIFKADQKKPLLRPEGLSWFTASGISSPLYLIKTIFRLMTSLAPLSYSIRIRYT